MTFGLKIKEGFLKVVSIFSFTGIALGVAILIIVMSVMNGFKTELIKKAKNHLRQNKLSSWLIYNYKGSNPFFEKIIGKKIDGLTRPIWFVIKVDQEPLIITHKLDSNFVLEEGLIIEEYTYRKSMKGYTTDHKRRKSSYRK